MLELLLEHVGNPNAEILERGTVILIVLSALVDEPKNDKTYAMFDIMPMN